MSDNRDQQQQQVYKILGSADFLGNPVGLFSSLGTGVLDFFYEPAQGLVKSPEDFGKGLAKVHWQSKKEKKNVIHFFALNRERRRC
jgi:hypothetical protein